MPRPARAAARRVSLAYDDDNNDDDEFQDDRAEKVARLKARQEQQTSQSPMRRLNVRRQRVSDASSVSEEADHRRQSNGSDKTPDRRHSGNLARTPGDKLRENQRRRVSNLVHTPVQVPLRGEDEVSNRLDFDTIRNSRALTPMKRVPVLANFEDWLNLATNNKINATNSWNFALIDYFHDMSLLKEGDGVNFQKASCTLDGCVKIYTGRVDSVAIETGRLLSGLTDNNDSEGKKKKRSADLDEDEDGEEEEDGEDGSQKRKRQRKTRSHEATLAPNFDALKVKKMELEFAVDPLFKKATADFDEGGAKGLLLNHLSIDNTGRIVFDSADDSQDDVPAAPSESTPAEVAGISPPRPPPPEADRDVDLSSLANRFFPNLSILDNLEICPSMANFKLGDPSAALDLDMIKSTEGFKTRSPEKGQHPPAQPLSFDVNISDASGIFLDGNNGDFDDNDDFVGGMSVEVGFGEGGEAWAAEAAAHAPPRLGRASVVGDEEDDDSTGGGGGVPGRFQESPEQEDFMALFHRAFNSRAKPGTRAFQTLLQNSSTKTGNWKIEKLKKAAEAEAVPTRQRKEKEPFLIDFAAGPTDSLKKLLKAESAANSAICLAKSQLRTKGKNLLDKDDEIVDVNRLMRLWTKPRCRVVRRRGKGAPYIVDEWYGGKHARMEVPQLDGSTDDAESEQLAGDYNANFFADDVEGLPFAGPLPGDDDDTIDNYGEGGIVVAGDPEFVDAREMLSPRPEPIDQYAEPANEEADRFDGQEQDQIPSTQQSEPLPGSFGSQLISNANMIKLRKLPPVQFAKTAKRVDVRVLKENMWRGMAQRLDIFDAPADLQLPVNNSEGTPDLDHDGDTDMSEDGARTPRQQLSKRSDPLEKSDELKFTSILSDLRSVYPEREMRDISTSFGFICLLHLANERGLILEGGREEGMMNEIVVRRDGTVGEGYVGE